MAAGDLVVANYQVELRLTLMGDTTNFGLGPDPVRHIDGLGAVEPKTADVELEQAAGSYGSPDYEGVRVILIPLVLEGTDVEVGGWVKTMNTTWRANATVDIPLYIQLPGFGKFFVNGRPRGWDPDLRLAQYGIVTGEATFVALDPTITYV